MTFDLFMVWSNLCPSCCGSTGRSYKTFADVQYNVVVFIRWANCGPWASCFNIVLVVKNQGPSISFFISRCLFYFKRKSDCCFFHISMHLKLSSCSFILTFNHLTHVFLMWTLPSLISDTSIVVCRQTNLENRMANNVDPDETARYKPSDLDLHGLHRYVFWAEKVKALNKVVADNILKLTLLFRENKNWDFRGVVC